MLSPPTDRLHKFLAIAGVALFILGVTIPLDRYDQTARQFIEAKSKVSELVGAQQRLSNILASLSKVLHSGVTAAPSASGAVADEIGRALSGGEPAKLEREIADLSIQAQKQMDLAEHAERIKAIWFVLGHSASSAEWHWPSWALRCGGVNLPMCANPANERASQRYGRWLPMSKD